MLMGRRSSCRGDSIARYYADLPVWFAIFMAVAVLLIGLARVLMPRVSTEVMLIRGTFFALHETL
jgi:hypothetical protein